MRYISLLLALIIYTTSVFSQSAPPSVKGQTDTTFQRPKPNLQLPNRQATNLGGLDTLLETGNKNRLANPGFEGTITGSSVAGWSSSLTGTATISYTAETSTFLIEGKKSLIISCAGGASGGTCTFFQDATSIAPVQYLASVYLNTSTASGFKVFSRVNGANTLSVDATNPLQPSLYKIPFTGGTTSSGIAIQMTAPASTTLQVVVDEAFVGAVDLKVDTNNISTWQSFTPTGTWNTNVTYSGKWRRVGDTAEVTFKATLSGSPNATNLAFNFPTSVIGQVDTTKITSTDIGNISLGGNVLDSGVERLGIDGLYVISSSTVNPYYYRTASGTNPVRTTFVDVSNVAPITFGAGDSVEVTIAVPIVGWASSGSIYSSTNADTDWADCTVTGTWTTNTTYSAKCRRAGSMLRMKVGISLSGTPNAANLVVNLPSGYVIDTSKLASSTGAQQLGQGLASNGAYYPVRAAYNTTTSLAINAFQGSSTTNHADVILSQTNPFTFAGGHTVTFDVEVPILGWENSNIIIGSFAEIPTTRGSNGADIQSVYFGAGTNCATACTTGNCTICNQVGSRITSVSWQATGVYRLNGIDGTKYNCSGNADNGSVFTILRHSRSVSTSSYAVLENANSSLANAVNASVTCIGIP